MTRKLCEDFYGSSLWDLKGNGVRMLCNSWDLSVKEAYKLDRRTHTHLVRSLSGTHQVHLELMSRSVVLIRKLLKSSSKEARTLANMLVHDRKSRLGENLETVRRECGVPPMFIGKEKFLDIVDTKMTVSEEDRRMEEALCKLLSVRIER